MAKAGHDYTAAKALYLKGIGISQISRELQIPYGTLQKQAIRKEWIKDRQDRGSKLSDALTKQLSDAASRHLLKITGLADRVVDALTAKDLTAMKLQDLNTFVKTLNDADVINRRSLGLDQENGKMQVNMSVCVSPPSTTKPLCAIIDVEPENGAAAAQLTDGK